MLFKKSLWFENQVYSNTLENQHYSIGYNAGSLPEIFELFDINGRFMGENELDGIYIPDLNTENQGIVLFNNQLNDSERMYVFDFETTLRAKELQDNRDKIRKSLEMFSKILVDESIPRFVSERFYDNRSALVTLAGETRSTRVIPELYHIARFDWDYYIRERALKALSCISQKSYIVDLIYECLEVEMERTSEIKAKIAHVGERPHTSFSRSELLGELMLHRCTMSEYFPLSLAEFRLIFYKKNREELKSALIDSYYHQIENLERIICETLESTWRCNITERHIPTLLNLLESILHHVPMSSSDITDRRSYSRYITEQYMYRGGQNFTLINKILFSASRICSLEAMQIFERAMESCNPRVVSQVKESLRAWVIAISWAIAQNKVHKPFFIIKKLEEINEKYDLMYFIQTQERFKNEDLLMKVPE